MNGGGGGGKRCSSSSSFSMVDFIVSALRKSSCGSPLHHMEIGWPSDVHHITHVTFDKFHGFLGLPLEFQLHVPSTPPSASGNVCGVSAESMQWSYDTRGNSVPTVLLLMQQKLYANNGLKAEGIFRINPENSQEKYVRAQLNGGIVPEDIDVHCLAGLIKAWFRELPSGVLDGLSPQQVLQCRTEEEYVELVKQLKSTERDLLSWAIDLMADVVEQEEHNKMDARNIAMVFAPNMTQVLDPVTALGHAVQVMNLLKTLIMKRLQEREKKATGAYLCREGDETENECGLTRHSYSSGDEEQQLHYSSCNEDRDEIESLNEMEYCFLRQIDVNENAKDGFRKQLERILCREHPSPRNCIVSQQ